METAPLKNFATWARTALIREVAARVAAVLAPGSSERVEQAKAVAALERAVAAAGGGDKGRSAVAEKVAYTWFNRIVALRFMDANGYTGIGIVSPQAGIEVGQPEILSEAKRGVVDTEVASQSTRTIVAGLLDGSRSSSDPQGEAYALLLADYCRYWNRAMPFMFEREGDYTELLIPANLLADDSVLNRAVTVLTEDVCKDVEVIGWLYQFYISERKDEVFAGFKKNKKAGVDEIPAATQLFTPHWIVRYLVENSLGRLWMLNRPASALASQMDYYIPPIDEETTFLKITKPEELKIIDPACGSGHMLTYAFDLLYAIYEEEGYGPADIPGLILTHNLHGTEIDPRAGTLAAFALTMKARARQRTFFSKQVEPNICIMNPVSFGPDEADFLVAAPGDRDAELAFWNQFAYSDTFGSLVQPDPDLTARLGDHIRSLADEGDMLRADVLERAQTVMVQANYLSQRYHVAVANPPYMGSKNMDARLAAFAKEVYPDAKGDLMTMFMRRCDRLVVSGGWWGMINLPSWMSLSTFTDLRDWLLRSSTIDTLLHFGRGVFGSDFGSVGFVIEKSPALAGRRGIYRKLFREHVEVRTNTAIEAHFLDAAFQRFEIPQHELFRVPGVPVAYWLSDAIRKAMQSPRTFRSAYPPKKGNDTGDNGRFLRYVWEVSRSRISFDTRSAEEAARSGRRWFPYNKGGSFRKWYGNFDLVVDWEDDGRRVRARGTLRNQGYYFREGVTWTDVSSGSFAARYLPPGFLCDNSGSACYGDDAVLPSALSFLCSSTASEMLKVLNPTMHFQAGNIADLPLLSIDDGLLESTVRQGVETAKADWDSYETSWDFSANPLIGQHPVKLAGVVAAHSAASLAIAKDQQARETQNNQIVADAHGVTDDVPLEVPLHRVSLSRNVEFRYGPGRSAEEYGVLERADLIAELVSYAVGCMFGRYSLDAPGLILADQGATLQDYLAKIPSPSFTPDADNVIPIIDGDWFEDDVVERFRQFLRTAFGEQHFEENLRFVTESLGVKTLRDYFVKSFYKDHVQRYKKRPIYWLFSSPRGSFSALVYVHRYQPTTVSTVLNEYLREFQAKLKAGLEHAERTNNAKEADRLRTILLELDAYEHDVLYPLASQNAVIDLDEGVKVNYPKFGAALKKIAGLEATE